MICDGSRPGTELEIRETETSSRRAAARQGGVQPVGLVLIGLPPSRGELPGAPAPRASSHRTAPQRRQSQAIPAALHRALAQSGRTTLTAVNVCSTSNEHTLYRGKCGDAGVPAYGVPGS
ncbi:unnamed protein product [Pieris brassicae]|uniref:Uncharacterized protein n=1 Tax=Pieris brassicae TaxID=7116 RepID=A0A9P0XDD5_PIEBR|nr:unnamed protein product [Pieris brassicae]